MRNVSIALFILISLGEISSFVFAEERLHWICKPLIMPCLAAYYLLQDSRNRSPVVLLAIAFSFLGDVALMIKTSPQLFFMIGLSLFLLAHLAYIFAYRQHQSRNVTAALQGVQKFRFSFPIILAGTGLVVVLYPTLGSLKIPVVIYAIVLILMVLNALFRYGRTSHKSFWAVFAGALVFMVSDSILALDKFKAPLAHADILVMTTYLAAQFLLIFGLCSHVDKQR